MRRSQSCSRVRRLVSAVLLLALSACGGGSGDDDGRIREQQQGAFIDSAVQGLGYGNADGSLRGVTGADGRFSYFGGDVVSFRLDCIPLGSAAGQAVITPRSLTGGQNNASTNIARLLLSLDRNGNSANGIDVTGLANCPAGLTTAIFDVEPAVFGTQPPLSTFIAANTRANADAGTSNGELVGADYANAHLSCSESGRTYANGVCGNTGNLPGLSIDDATATEGGELSFSVTLSAASTQTVTVQFSVTPGSASADDYSVTTASPLTFAAGETSKTIVVAATDDATDENDETFTVTLANPTNATITDASATGTIVDNDGPITPGVLSINDVTVTEGSSGTTNATFTVTRSTSTAGTASVTVNTQDGTATAPEDYTALVNQSVSFADGEAAKTVTVQVKGDTVVEPNETFTVTLSSPQNATLGDASGTGTITNDDQTPPPPGGFPLCAPDEIPGIGGSCLSDIPVIGPPLQAAVDTLYDTVTGGEPPGGVPGGPGDGDAALLPEAARTQLQGCDFLDPSNCLYPFPNDWFTAAAAPGSVQHPDRGGTGRRVNIHPSATPRNTAGKPVDPTEWNRNDGFSPGALITTFVPGLSLEKTFDLPLHQIGLANLALSQDEDAPILVLEVQADGAAPVRHLVWSEIDQNANQLTVAAVPNVGTFPVEGVTDDKGHVQRPQNDGRAALLIRPAKNFSEGRRYVVVLRRLKDGDGNPIAAQAGFRACVRGDSQLPPVQARCAQLDDAARDDDVFDVLDAADIDPAEVYLAWDFTVASTENQIARLRHMRDDAFRALSADPADEDCTRLTPANAATCAAPGIEITRVIENPQGGIARRIEGMLTVPNYLAPIAPAPLDNATVTGAQNRLCASAPAGQLADGCGDLRDAGDIAQGLALPSRLFYSPADGSPVPDPDNAADPAGLRYGDGLPDQNGSMTTRFLCQIPAQATPDTPARASLYGHGQLDRGIAITYEGTPDVAREHNFMFCAVDWFGFRTGDAVNVLSALVDVSNFPVIPDASQQGMLNFLFLARAMAHPQGLGALAPFQMAGRPVFDRSEIFYNGNSQGGIFGGVVLAVSKDVNRGVLGSLGMNYSTLLTRSKNFDQFAGVLYNSYTDPLDRQLLFSMIQMLWDRSENNGYAAHLVDNRAFGGPANVAKLDPQFGDPQVTMWTAEIMARTMGVPFDDRQSRVVETLGEQYRGVNERRHPDVEPYFGLAPLDYDDPQQTAGGALIVWDTKLRGEYSDIPPTTNTPPRTGVDNHDASQLTRFGRCHMAHFLRTGGQLINTLPPNFDFTTAACPPVPAPAPTTAPGTQPEGGDDPLAAAGRGVGALTVALEQLAQGNLLPAFNALFGGAQQLLADLYAIGAQQLGQLAGLMLPAPGVDAEPVAHTPQPLMAGVAKGPIRVPVGTPLGGYLRPPVGGEYIPGAEAFAEGDPSLFLGELVDFIPAMADACDPAQPETCPPLAPLPDELRKVHSPYATLSPPSRGYYDSLIAKAVALYDGQDYVVLVKTDLIGMLDEVVQDVKADVKQRTGIDLGDGLIVSATHTHGGPGAVANHSTRYFWLAADVYHHDVYRRLVPQLADVVVAALADLQPARIGHGSGAEVEGLNGYRRGRLASYDINKNNALLRRIGVLRVDDLDGNPRAVVINWAAHGIAFDVENQFFSGDVLGAVERETEQLMQVPVAMLVQSAGGDVSPRGVSNDNKLQRIESYGKRLAPQVKAIAEAIPAQNLQSAPDLRSVSQRVILNRERLGYAPQEYPYPWGAGQCGNDISVPFAGVGVNDIPGYGDTGLPVKNPFCLPSPPPDAVDLADNGVAENGSFYPQDSILYATQIGDIQLLVQPGEPLVEYGVRLLDMAEAAGFARNNVFVWGYSGDHIGYILPPEEVDWATFGGAESTTTFWGWKQGQRFLDVSRELLLSLRDRRAPPADEFQADYSLYKSFYEQTPPPPAAPSLLPGSVAEEPADIRRFETTRFVFEGGDPVLDFPSVQMQQLVAGQWQPVRRANGEPLEDFFEMHLKYRLVSGRHLWTLEFEASKEWVAGRYRFSASGRAQQAGETAYMVSSEPFNIGVAANLQVRELQCSNGQCSARLAYTPQPRNYRVIDPRVPADQPAPVRGGTMTFTNGVTSVVAADGNNDGLYEAAIGGTVTASGVDAFGNTTPAAPGPGPGPGPGEATPTGASLPAQCRLRAPEAVCAGFEDAVQPLVEGCQSGGEPFGEDAAEAFCRGVLTGDLDQLSRLCLDSSPQPAGCAPFRSLADVLATRNRWYPREFLNISHRGGADEFPENTLYAYAESLKAGSQMIEADVYQTADGELVVIHDATVDRTTNGSGAVNTMTLAQIKALDAAHCFARAAGAPFGGTNCGAAGPFPFRGVATGAVAPPAGYSANDFRIPTLRELLQRFPDTLINLELKPDERGAGSYEGRMAALLAEFGRSDDVIVASFLDSAALAFKAQAPQVSTSVPTGQVALAVATGQGPAQGVTVGHEAFQVPTEFGGVPVTSQEFVVDAHARGLAVHVWTIDDPAVMRELLCLGVDGIMTDRPSLLRTVLENFDPDADCAAPPPAMGAGSVGLLPLIADTLGGFGQALLLALTGDMTGAQERFVAAAGGLVDGLGALLTDDPEHSLVATLQRFGENLAAAFASPGPGTPEASVRAGEILRDDARVLLGLAPPLEQASCTADNRAWETYEAYKGSLHEHSGYSDGTVGTTPAQYFAQGKALGLDFMGSSEHSDNALLPVTASQDCASPDFADCVMPQPTPANPAAPVSKWELTRQQARGASDAGFTAFRGFEWTSDRFGHINVFFSRNDYNAKTTEGYTLSMESFWAWFTTRAEAGGGADGLLVFNHPGREDMIESSAPVSDPAYAFNDFEYRPEADLRAVGIEVFGKGGDAYDTDNGAPAGGWYAFALDRGWHVGPVGAEDEHGTSWGQPSRAKTVLIARENSEGALREAMLARRFYALSQGHNDLVVEFGAGDLPMGARLARAPGVAVELVGRVSGAAVARVEIVSRGGAVVAQAAGNQVSHVAIAAAGERWYYLRAIRADGRPIAYSAPVWLRAGGEYPVCGEWLAGDLHVHSTHSHDSYGGPNELADPLAQALPASRDVLTGDSNTGPDEFFTLGHSVRNQFRIAALRGLDYLAITDHNDIRSHSDPGRGELGLIHLPSYENSLNGHAQMHGARQLYAGGSSLAGAQAQAAALRADGGVFQINHPADRNPGPYPDNLGWSYGFELVPDTIEVWNIGVRAYQAPFPAYTNNDDSTRFWEDFLDRGHRVGATGGSDNHWVSLTAVAGAGQPTTWVYATERSAHGLLDGLRAGRTFISHQPPVQAGPRIVLEADADGDGRFESGLGDAVPAAARFRVRASGAPGALLRVLGSRGQGATPLFAPVPLAGGEVSYEFSLPAGQRWLRAELALEDAQAQRQALEDPACAQLGALGEAGFPEDTRTTYCRNRLLVLAMTSAMYIAE